MERVMGIEPTYSAWKAEVLPLNYTRMLSPVPGRPAWSPSPVAKTHTTPLLSGTGGGGRIRTFEGISRQIYSLLPLAAWVPLREQRAAYSQGAGRPCQSKPSAASHSSSGCRPASGRASKARRWVHGCVRTGHSRDQVRRRFDPLMDAVEPMATFVRAGKVR